MQVIPFPNIIQVQNIQINNARISAEGRSQLYHYTNLETLSIILSDKTFLLNRIDKVNDLMESAYLQLPEVYSCVFAGCFSHRKIESIPHWHMYTKADRGVRINFLLKMPLGKNLDGFMDKKRSIVVKYNEDELLYNFSGNFNGNLCDCDNTSWKLELSTSDIIYEASCMERNPILINIDGVTHSDIIPIGKIKREEWDFEYETRIIGLFRNINSNVEFNAPEYILIPIDLESLELEIILNPWCSEDFKSEVKALLVANKLEDKVNVFESSLHNTIKKPF